MKAKKVLWWVMFMGSLAMGSTHAETPLRRHCHAPFIQGIIENDTTVKTQTSNTAAQVYAKPEVPVLCYHRLTEGMKSEYAVRPATFAAHLKILADSGYHTISPAQLYNYLVYNAALPEKPVLITFDDSRAEQATIAAPLLEKHGFRGVFFIMTVTCNKPKYLSKEQITHLAKAGHTIGLHSWDHTMVTHYHTPSHWHKQMAEPKQMLEKLTGQSIDYWAYPNGVYDHKSAEMLSHSFKLSFILSSRGDSTYPLQTIRRLIIPEMTPPHLLKSMQATFGKSQQADVVYRPLEGSYWMKGER